MVDVKFPKFDEPDSSGKGTPGDHVPYIDLVKQRRERLMHFLSDPIIWDAGMWNGYVRFRFASDGPIMRYNIIWSRPGRKETDMRWVDPTKFSSSEDYIINERPIPDTEYSFQVQAEGRDKKPTFHGPNNPYTYDYDRTRFVDKTFHTPPAPSVSDRATQIEKHGASSAPGPKRNPLQDRVDEELQVIPHPIVGKKDKVDRRAKRK